MFISSLSNFDITKEHLKSIENLDLFFRISADELPQIQNFSIYLQNVTKFKFRYHLQLEDRPESIPKIPFSFSQLKEFTIYDRLSTFDVFLTFFSENQMIEKLTFQCELLFRLICTGQLQDALPSLKHIVYEGSVIKNMETLKNDLSYFEFLKSFTFYTDLADDQIRSVCANKWRVSHNRKNRFSKFFITLECIESTI